MKLLQPRRFHPLKAAWVLLFLGAYFLYTTNRDRAPRQWALQGEAFGSTYAVQLVTTRRQEAALDQLRADIDATLARMDASMSTWKAGSELSRFNASSNLTPVAVAPDLAAATRIALEVSRRSDGVFDSTFHPLFALWGFGGTNGHHPPAPDDLARVRAQCGWSNLLVLAGDQVQKRVPGLQYNLNALVPGYAADRLADLLRARGLTNFYVDVGGEAVVEGGKRPGQPWRIGIEKPVRDAPPGATLHAIVGLTNGALATSGDYRNYFEGADGQIYSHLFDPRVGRPATTRVASVSVVYTNAAWADALATTLFVMGPEEGLTWITNVPGAEAYFLMRDGTGLLERASTGFARHLVH